MKKLDISPSDENINKLLKSNFGAANENYSNFIEFLTEHANNMIISLDGPWGSGKTFFIKSVIFLLKKMYYKEPLDEIDHFSNYKKEISNKTIYYDAWQHDTSVDPIISLIIEIISQLKINYKFKSTSTLSLIMTTIDVFTNRDISSLQKKIIDDEYLSTEREIIRFKERIKKFFTDEVTNQKSHVIIFIDELDRCNPTYAVKLLERIKHYFDLENITFVFSTNLSQLQYTVKAYYGNDFAAYSYLDRFFDLNIPMPSIDRNSYLTGLSKQPSPIIKWLFQTYNLQLREVNHFYQLCDIVEKAQEKHKSSYDSTSYEFVTRFIFPLLIVLKIKSIDEYTSFINGNNPNPLISLCLAMQEDYLLDKFFKSPDFITPGTIKHQSGTVHFSPDGKEYQQAIGYIYDIIFKNESHKQLSIFYFAGIDNNFFKKFNL